MQNFRKLARLEITKIRGELYNDVNIAKSENLSKKTARIQEISRNTKNKKNRVVLKFSFMLLWLHTGFRGYKVPLQATQP